jgi:hypothetical protein
MPLVATYPSAVRHEARRVSETDEPSWGAVRRTGGSGEADCALPLRGRRLRVALSGPATCADGRRR